MKKPLIIVFAVCFTTFIAFYCSSTNAITEFYTETPDQLLPKLKELLLVDNFVIEEENAVSGTLNTAWKKLSRSENNIPDHTIEGKIEIKLDRTKDVTLLVAKIRKRSSLYSEQRKGTNVSYSEVGIMMNDLLYMRWNKIISTLKKEEK